MTLNRFRIAALSLTIATAALAAVPAAQAEVVTATRSSLITIPDAGNASPYPSELNLEGADGVMTDVNVSITFSHSHPDDLDIALVSPDGDSTILMSDACGEVPPAGGTIVFDDAAASAQADNGSCGSLVRPTNFNTGDSWPSPGPGSITEAVLSRFNGEDPNGVWKLFIVDDIGGDEGTVLSWSVTATTQKAEIVVPPSGSSGPADPFPATKSFETPPGKVITDVDLELNEFFHMHPDDVDILLAGPRRGATALVMSDACGSTDIHDYAWTFSDEATAPMSDSDITGCNPFSIKPSDFGGGADPFPAPAPAGPYTTTLSAFDALDGGEWQLFVNDDGGGDTGFITGWAVKLTTRDAAEASFAANAIQVFEGTTAVLQVTRASAATPLGPATLALDVRPGSAGREDVGTPTTIEFAREELVQTVSIPIPADGAAEGAETFEVALAAPRDDARPAGQTSVAVTINPSVGAAGVGAGSSPPSNKFRFGKLVRNAKKGTGNLKVEVPGPGLLVLSGKKVKPVSKTVGQAGSVGVPVKPKSQALDLLEEEGSAKLGFKVTFTPVGGTASTLPKSVKLFLND